MVIAGVGPDRPQIIEPARRGNLGGGLLELLITGRDPTPAQGVARVERPTQPREQASLAAAYPGLYRANAASNEPGAARQAAPAPAVGAEFTRQDVDYDGDGKLGSIVIDTPHHYLYYIVASGRAIRYGVGVGRPGFEWSGVKSVSRKSEWPDWTPPPEMLLRRPDLPTHMDGGPKNPLGARALYLGSSMYRIHGTNEPGTIGQNVSSGCIRMMNEDVIDLYDRVKIGARVFVL